MATRGSSAKAKGSRLEREFARTFGARRTPGSGALGGGDITPELGDVWRDWSWEVKGRAQLPAIVGAALRQAESDIALGDRRRPAAALREDGGRWLVTFYWDDLREWVEALAEVGRSGEVRRLAAQIESAAREIRRAAK